MNSMLRETIFGSFFIFGNPTGEQYLIENNTFINTDNMTIMAAEFTEAERVVIKNNLFYYSGVLTLDGASYGSSLIRIEYNSFINSKENIVKLKDEGRANAMNNYWGTTDETEISSMIWDNYDDLALNEISFKLSKRCVCINFIL